MDEPGDNEMKRLYVGNLSWGVTDGDLETLFSEFGSVRSATVQP